MNTKRGNGIESTDSGMRDPLAYWASKQDRYSRLSRMAMDFMTIQLMSAECEIFFGSWKDGTTYASSFRCYNYRDLPDFAILV
jgi:hypothetical protein